MTKIKLIFEIFGDLLNPNSFTEITKLSPTSFWFKGDAIPNRKLGLTRKETCWEYSFDFIHTLYFDDVANLFIQHFSPYLEDIVKYIEENNLETKVDVVVEIINDEKPTLSFDKKFMNLIVKMNGEIDIDLYYMNE
ncbi:DUF4279 domain-containing protein [Peijinzhouia sedimentorum]